MTARERPGNRTLALARADVAREYHLLAELAASEDRPFAQVHYSGDPLSESTMRSVLRGTAHLVRAAERMVAKSDQQD